MRTLLLGMGILAAAFTFTNVQPAEAAQRQFCLSGNKANGGMPECSFYTWQQCIASTSGSDSCYVNPWYAGPTEPQGRRVNQRRTSQRY